MILRVFDDQPSGAKAKGAAILALLGVANLAAWIWAWSVFGDQPTLMGTAFIAYLFGLRHAFDADHIAAIDNVVRKLMQQGKAPYFVGFFFSLGHSSIVVLATLAIVGATAVMQDRLTEFRETIGMVGVTVSATFLLLIGVANLFILRGIWAAFARARRGERIVDQDLDALAAGGGLLSRVFRPMFRIVSRSWHMYPIGFLFGLGFDTATEIGLLGISAAQAAQGMSFWTILVFPALFTAGMSLMDTIDSMTMTHAYGWAFLNPIRKLWYNLTITAASVVVALFIGGIEALSLIGDRLGFTGGIWGWIGGLNESLASFGFIVVGIFVLSWLISTVIYRARGYDRLEPGQP